MNVPKEISDLLQRFKKLEDNKEDFCDPEKGYGFEVNRE